MTFYARFASVTYSNPVSRIVSWLFRAATWTCISSQEMELLGEQEEPLKQIEHDVFAAMRAFYVELATYVNVSHTAKFGALVSKADSCEVLKITNSRLFCELTSIVMVTLRCAEFTSHITILDSIAF